MTLAQLKRGFLEELLAGGPSVAVVLDPRRAGVSAPPEFEGKDHLTLRLGYNLKPPIFLEITDDGFSASLLFGGIIWPCVVPWGALLAAQAEYGPFGFSWPESGKAREVAPAPEPAKRAKLSLV